MGDLIEVDFDNKESFRKKMSSIIDDLIECLRTHYGDDAGDLMASSFSVCLDEISVRVTKQLELRQKEEEADILFTSDNDIDILFTSDFKLG